MYVILQLCKIFWDQVIQKLNKPLGSIQVNAAIYLQGLECLFLSLCCSRRVASQYSPKDPVSNLSKKN